MHSLSFFAGLWFREYREGTGKEGNFANISLYLSSETVSEPNYYPASSETIDRILILTLGLKLDTYVNRMPS